MAREESQVISKNVCWLTCQFNLLLYIILSSINLNKWQALSSRAANPSNAGTSRHTDTGPSRLQGLRAEDQKGTKWHSW